MTKADTNLVWALLLLVSSAYLISTPNCNQGCRTVLEHVLTHELDNLVGGLA